MEQVIGTIRSGEEILVDNISMYVGVYNRNGRRWWNGSFNSPRPMPIDSDGPFQLELQDGRKGQLFFTKQTIDRRGISVRFDGTGPLEC